MLSERQKVMRLVLQNSKPVRVSGNFACLDISRRDKLC